MNIQNNLEGTAFQNGYEIAKNKGLAIVGMSPGNSYFKKETIDKLLKYCSSMFSSVKIMIADMPMRHTYRARGYTSAQAEKKARLNGNTLQNHSQRTIDEIAEGNVSLIEWKDEIDPQEAYQAELSRIASLYKNKPSFRQDVRYTTRQVLEGKLKPGVTIESAIDEGAYYLIKELAFLSVSPKIFNTERIAYVYHNRWEIYEDFINGKYDGNKRDDLGFVVIK